MSDESNKLDLLRLKSQLYERSQLGLLRQRKIIQSPCANEISTEDFNGINFASNDYLGLANSTASKAIIKRSVDQIGFGSGASHLICGHHLAHDQLEQALANFLNRQAAITFSSGYMANLSILQTLANKGDLIIADKLNHASLIDGVRLSDADSARYLHCDLNSLETRLKKSAANKFVVTDSVFSMDGDIAPLPEIAELCQNYDAILIVDDAHGFGVLGKSGRGCCEHFGLDENQVPVLMSTLGKSLGGVGACVSGKQELVDYLIQFARPYIYTTAMPAINALANLANLAELESAEDLIEKLRENIRYFKQLCVDNQIELLASDTAIQPVLIGDNERLMAISSELAENGFMVGAIRPPTVPANSARLRVTLSASHEKHQISALAECLGNLLRKFNN